MVTTKVDDPISQDMEVMEIVTPIILKQLGMQPVGRFDEDILRLYNHIYSQKDQQ